MKKQYVSPACIAVDCRIDQPLLDESTWGVSGASGTGNGGHTEDYTGDPKTDGDNIFNGPPYFYTGFGDE